MDFLTAVKNALGIVGDYQDDMLSQYIDEVISFLNDAGVPTAKIPSGIVTRGVADLWSFGAGNGELSEYFKMRATQLSYKG